MNRLTGPLDITPVLSHPKATEHLLQACCNCGITLEKVIGFKVN